MLHPLNEHKEIERPLYVAYPTAVSDHPVPESERYVTGPAVIPTITSALWKRRRPLITAAVFGLLAGLALTAFTTPIYRAHTSLQLEGFNDQALGGITPVSPLPNASAEDYLQNQVKILESDTLARRVADQLGAKFDATLGTKKPVSEAQRLRAMKKAITVRTALQSQVIDVFFDSPDPQLAATGANAVMSQFIALNREARWQLVQDTTEWLNKQAAELKLRLGDLDRQLQQFIARTGLVLTGKDGTPAEERSRTLQDALTRAEADRAGKQARYEAATANQGEIAPDPISASPLRQYETDLQNMRRQLADLSTIYTPDNYRITRLKAQIADTESAITKERKDIVDRMHGDYVAASSLEHMLSNSLASQLTTVEDQTEKELQFNVLKNEADTAQKLYDSVLERAKDAGAASSLRVTNVRVIDQATPPARPYIPNAPLNAALGLGIGIIGGCGLVLLGARSRKVRQPGDLDAVCLPELGHVPSNSNKLTIPGQGWNTRIKGFEKDRFDASLLRESFRSVLLSILSSTRIRHNAARDGDRSRVLVVTSLEMREGKTTIVTNLGIAASQQQRKVLLIDADLRKPRLHERFGLSNRCGLTTMLQPNSIKGSLDGSSSMSLVQSTYLPNLWVLTSGPTDDSSINLLHSSDLETPLRKLAHRFDVILIDTPPLFLCADARILGQASDGVVMVVRANTKSREEMRAAYQQLMRDQIPFLGMILNDWKIDRDQAKSYTRYYQHYTPNTPAPL